MFYINFKLPTQQVVFFAQDLFLILTHYQLTTLCKWSDVLFFFMYNTTDAARELEEGERKKKPNCFALGPVFDDFAKRTYYISCGEFVC